ncbi:DUF2812 domain-containing protein [Oceanirhabdus seepicola]|uniref:DUF2812 domain-containing protein n=1 Tax=Oceanirhabdus seepicola TaxID=2828781 RepID=A0A9J6NWE6_9CLOT|nr:DUF2812 domain-containing protein [Oceanirhabdus seepicola]MCM1988334.1 DUF2812 domain-containing protein [Oceanirhabdus seepicola]
MKNKTKKRIKFTSITEYKILEEYFEKMAAKGWMLKEYKKSIMVFEEIEPKELDFNVSLFYNTTPFDYPDHEKDNEYRELCEESGWTFCASNQLYQVFCKEKNQEAIPIHTDSSEEFTIIKKTYMKTELISMIALLPIICLGFFHILKFDYEDILSNGDLFNIISPFFLFIIIISTHFYPVFWLIKNKSNISKGKELYFSTNKGKLGRDILMWSLIGIYFIMLVFMVFTDIPHISFILIAFAPMVIGILIGSYCVKRFKTKKRSRTHNILFFIGGIILSFVLTMLVLIGGIRMMISSDFMDKKNETPPEHMRVLKLSDFTEIDSIKRTRLYKKSSIFVPISFSYYEIADKNSRKDGIISVDTEYIQCKNKDVADFVFEGYMKKEFERKEERAKEAREWGSEERAISYENDIKEVSIQKWGVDRGYYLYESKNEIIIQKDNLIYVLGIHGDKDLSEKEIINICRNKLGLN